MTPEIIIVYVVGAALAAWLGYEIWWHLKYKKVYSEEKEDKGIVTDMEYTPPRTRVTKVGKSTSVSTTPAKHVVCIKFENMGNKRYDDVELYETVRMDDDVTAKYIEVWRVEKENPRNKTLMRYETKSVTSPKGRIVKI